MAEVVIRIIDVYAFRQTGAGAQFLMLKRAGGGQLGGTWQAVHGKIEAGETAAAAALRELAEETGLRPARFWQLEHVNTFFDAARDAVYMCPGFAAEIAADALVQLNAEHVAFEWLGAAAASDRMMWPGQRTALREIVDVILAGHHSEPHLRIELKS